MGALGAERSGRRKLGSAVGAGACQGRRALLAELPAGAVLVLTPRTLHCEPWSLSLFCGRREFSETKGGRLCSVCITPPLTRRRPTEPQAREDGYRAERHVGPLFQDVDLGDFTV